jgi:hypothetical protein
MTGYWNLCGIVNYKENYSVAGLREVAEMHEVEQTEVWPTLLMWCSHRAWI